MTVNYALGTQFKSHYNNIDFKQKCEVPFNPQGRPKLNKKGKNYQLKKETGMRSGSKTPS